MDIWGVNVFLDGENGAVPYIHPNKYSDLWIIVLLVLFCFFSEQCLKYTSMVGLQTPPWNLMSWEPVMLQVPVYWSWRNHTTCQLQSALLQILSIPEIHSVELFFLLSVFALLWSLWLQSEFGSSEKER